ncbi:MAG TPA: TetR/AcrR family transcriptional regulator [Drouetiella sp.]
MPKHTKQKIFDEALDLLGEQGFSGLTLGSLAARSNLSKSGLFAHFKSKTELEDQLLKEVELKGAPFIAKALQMPKGLTRLSNFFEGWIGWTTKAGLKGGCAIAAGMFEFDDAEENNPTRRALQNSSIQWHQILLNLCDDAINTGELAADTDKEQFLFELYGIYLSHHVSLRFHKDPAADQRAMTAFARLVKDNQERKKRK